MESLDEVESALHSHVRREEEARRSQDSLRDMA